MRQSRQRIADHCQRDADALRDLDHRHQSQDLARVAPLIALQIAALPGLRAGASGSRGSRLFRADDNSKAVMVSVFDTAEDFKRFTDSAPIAAHRAKMLQYLERAEASHYQLVYQSGDV